MPGRPTQVDRFLALLRQVVADTLTVARRLACALARSALRDAIQAFIDGVALECPECLPWLLPAAEAAFLAAVQELDKVCHP